MHAHLRSISNLLFYLLLKHPMQPLVIGLKINIVGLVRSLNTGCMKNSNLEFEKLTTTYTKALIIESTTSVTV